MPRQYFHLHAFALLLFGAVAACGIFGAGDESADDAGESSSDFTADGETGELPDVGLRVYPKYMQMDLQAIVTLDVNSTPVLCPPDDDDGGYLCDISDLSSDTALVRVERDGFETKLAQPAIEQGVIQSIDVELEPAG